MLAAVQFEKPRGYAAWRERKLAGYPKSAEELIVEVRDPRKLSAAERAAILERCARANIAVYASRCGEESDKEIARALGLQFGLARLDPNWLADDDGISSIAVREGAARGEFIPYTSKAIRWHTDGYYNPPERRIRAFVLHCVRGAAEGGETQLFDHELAYLLLRDANPDWARALMRPNAMTIPERASGGDVERATQSGPVFSFDDRGALHMRYTARSVSIQWAADPDTAAAVQFLAQILSDDAHFALRLKLAPGMGVICNNVLHTRSAFRDDPTRPRLLYRARYYDRIRG
ncbi:MAG: TauD/TfdA family dioxygenase [Betaproteobacteria bacterium]|nr:TauD/TfdA family dioxygenase [Betaproteobacteria bacterium]